MNTENHILVTSKRLLIFIQILSSADYVSKAEIEEKLNLKKSAFYKYLKVVKEVFPVEHVGTIGQNSYYSIDKKAIQKFFNL